MGGRVEIDGFIIYFTNEFYLKLMKNVNFCFHKDEIYDKISKVLISKALKGAFMNSI